MGETRVHLDESGIARLHGAVPRVHVPREDFFSDRHGTRRCVDGMILFAALRARFHESEETAVPHDAPRKIVEAAGRFIHIHTGASGDPLRERQTANGEHAVVDEVLTVDRRDTGRKDNADPRIEQGQCGHLA